MGKITIKKGGRINRFMSTKKGDGVPTVGTMNIGKQKNQDVEHANELAPTGRGTTKLQDDTKKKKQKEKN